MEASSPHYPHLRRSLWLLVALLGLWVFFRQGSSVWWDVPTMEFAVLYQQTGSLPSGDAHLDCLSADGYPGRTFALLIKAVADAGGWDWYAVVYALAALSAGLLPALLFRWLVVALRLTSPASLLAAFTAVVLVLAPDLRDFCTIAYWPPFLPGGSAQTVAALLALLAMNLTPHTRQTGRLLVPGALWIGAAWMHPLSAFYWLLAHLLMDVQLPWRHWLWWLTSVLGPLLFFVQYIITLQGDLSGAQLAEHLAYTANQFQSLPARYAVSFPRISWQWSFGALLGLGALCAVLLWVKKKRMLAVRAAALLAVYLLAWFIPQYFIAQHPQGWAVVAQPARLFQLGWWVAVWSGLAFLFVPSDDSVRHTGKYLWIWVLLALAAVCATALLTDSGVAPLLAAALAVLAYYACRLHTHRRIRQAYLLLWALALPFTLWMGIRAHRMDSRYAQYLPHQHFHNWAQRYTPPTAVFLTFDGLVSPKEIYLITGRRSYLEPSIQLWPDCLAEQSARRIAVFGDSLLRQEAYSQGYAQLDTRRVLQLARDRPLDFVLIARVYQPRFLGLPEFTQDSLFVVYRVDSLRARWDRRLQP
ncbi:MAG: hypothetical protein KF690_00455 [Bacteroidetes bacterium]|nr:hypothetical protein [Bacteroidota bacterium]